MRIVGIIIIILVLGFFGGYGIMQSQIDDQKEFKEMLVEWFYSGSWVKEESEETYA